MEKKKHRRRFDWYDALVLGQVAGALYLVIAIFIDLIEFMLII